MPLGLKGHMSMTFGIVASFQVEGHFSQFNIFIQCLYSLAMFIPTSCFEFRKERDVQRSHSTCSTISTPVLTPDSSNTEALPVARGV